MTDHSAMPLGRSSIRVDARTLRAAKYYTAMEPAPASADWTIGIPDNVWGMMLNDTLGDCTIAAWGHFVQIWTAAIGALFTIPDALILAGYEAMGYDPTNPFTDKGCVELDVLLLAQAQGIGGHKLGAFAAVDPQNTQHVMQTIATFGGIYVGAAMPVSAKTQDVWDVTTGPDSIPGSWGGHAFIVVAYDAAGVTVISWGKKIRVTWAWFFTYVDEAYALVSPDWFVAGKDPCGLDVVTLTADLAAVQAAA